MIRSSVFVFFKNLLTLDLTLIYKPLISQYGSHQF